MAVYHRRYRSKSYLVSGQSNSGFGFMQSSTQKTSLLGRYQSACESIAVSPSVASYLLNGNVTLSTTEMCSVGVGTKPVDIVQIINDLWLSTPTRTRKPAQSQVYAA